MRTELQNYVYLLVFNEAVVIADNERRVEGLHRFDFLQSFNAHLLRHDGHVNHLDYVERVLQKSLVFVYVYLTTILGDQSYHIRLRFFYLLCAHSLSAVLRDVRGLKTLHFVDVTKGACSQGAYVFEDLPR